ncbi:hypothetical protein [Haladaptatus cibarius]|uniref:hypothetical protein n=1 Tax=Haladaptatus cibarius TaxID=453847 RepID=UPI0011870B0E|nr:hypothetical protein [Haladaptatus cibarius]
MTLAVDADDATKFDPEEQYRFETLPQHTRPEREFVAQLRAADKTMGVVMVEPESNLVGLPIGSLDAIVVAVRPTDSTIATLPVRRRLLAQPTVLRRIERSAATKLETSGRENAKMETGDGQNSAQ